MALAVDEQTRRIAESFVVVDDKKVHITVSMTQRSTGQAKGEDGAVAQRAFASQFPVHGQHELFNDAQTEAGGGLASRGTRRKAAIAAEHAGFIVFAEPGPFILHLAFDVPDPWRAEGEANLL